MLGFDFLLIFSTSVLCLGRGTPRWRMSPSSSCILCRNICLPPTITPQLLLQNLDKELPAPLLLPFEIHLHHEDEGLLLPFPIKLLLHHLDEGLLLGRHLFMELHHLKVKDSTPPQNPAVWSRWRTPGSSPPPQGRAPHSRNQLQAAAQSRSASRQPWRERNLKQYFRKHFYKLHTWRFVVRIKVDIRMFSDSSTWSLKKFIVQDYGMYGIQNLYHREELFWNQFKLSLFIFAIYSLPVS